MFAHPTYRVTGERETLPYRRKLSGTTGLTILLHLLCNQMTIKKNIRRWTNEHVKLKQRAASSEERCHNSSHMYLPLKKIVLLAPNYVRQSIARVPSDGRIQIFIAILVLRLKCCEQLRHFGARILAATHMHHGDKRRAHQDTAQTSLPLDENEAMEFQPYGNFLFIFIYFFLLSAALHFGRWVCVQRLHNQIFFFIWDFLCTSRSDAGVYVCWW